MGYDTRFKGSWKLNKKLDDATYNFLVKLNETRRMKRNVASAYGVEGEFYVIGTGSFGQDRDATVVDYNNPPITQPGLWNHWKPSEDRMSIEFDDGEKFYGYIEWIEYIISKVLAPRGYVLNGTVKWRGEEFDDSGTIEIHDNIVNGKRLIVDYSINKLLALPKEITVNVAPVPKKKAVGKVSKKDLEIASLESKIKQLETELKEKSKAPTTKLSAKDSALLNIKEKGNIAGTLEEFKSLLKSLLE